MTSGMRGTPSAAARAEAAAWVARLHGPNRTPEVEAGLRRWLSEDPERAAALELITETWEKSAQLAQAPSGRERWRSGSARPARRVLNLSRVAFGSLAVALVLLLGVLVYLKPDGASTGVGEQRTLVLEDGSRIVLNTDSRAVVDYDRRVRRVRLEKGEALFEVAKRPGWPFVVTAAGREVRAFGTAFLVRKQDAQDLVVTLVEGKVTVGRELVGAASIASSGDSTRPDGTPAVFTLSPGQRLTFDARQSPRIDHPSLERVTAWQRGQVVLDETRLGDAAAEMNRYNRVHLVVEDSGTADTPVSGVFRAADLDSFAEAVAKTYHLEIRRSEGKIVLAGRAAAN